MEYHREKMDRQELIKALRRASKPACMAETDQTEDQELMAEAANELENPEPSEEKKCQSVQ